MSIKDKIYNWFVGQNTNVPTKDYWLKEKLMAIPKGMSILDAGAGELQWKKFCTHLKYTSQDFAQYDGKASDYGAQLENWKYPHIDIVSDITSIPVKDESFDYVLCTEVFEHVPDPCKAIKELIRVTKKGGYLILTAPFSSLTHMAPYHFCTGFNRFWYEKNLEESGCKIIECVMNGDCYAWLRQEILRLPSTIRKYKGKSHKFFNIRCALMAHSLNKLSNTKDKSGELVCFEYMVVAQKVGLYDCNK